VYYVKCIQFVWFSNPSNCYTIIVYPVRQCLYIIILSTNNNHDISFVIIIVHTSTPATEDRTNVGSCYLIIILGIIMFEMCVRDKLKSSFRVYIYSLKAKDPLLMNLRFNYLGPFLKAFRDGPFTYKIQNL